MELTYDNVVKWFDGYFKAFNRNAGPLKTVSNMEKFFAPDLQFWPYNMADTKQPMSREALLMTMVHPGLHEELTPKYYVVDLKQMVVVVQFQLEFTDEPSGRVWPARQASAHYHVMLDKNKNLKIKKIVYSTERHAPEETAPLMELWKKYREEAIAEQQK